MPPGFTSTDDSVPVTAPEVEGAPRPNICTVQLVVTAAASSPQDRMTEEREKERTEEARDIRFGCEAAGAKRCVVGGNGDVVFGVTGVTGAKFV